MQSHKVVSLNPDRGTMVGYEFLVQPGIWYGLLIRIYLEYYRRREALNYRPSAPSLYKVACHVKTAISAVIIIIIIIIFISGTYLCIR